ncbi:MAG TPA: hypothetical protein VF145_06785 [Chitinophagaceae bacterium]
MNLAELYKEIFGPEIKPGEAELQALVDTIAFLPDQQFYAVFHHYYHGKAIECVAEEAGRPPAVVELWRSQGVGMMRLFFRKYKDE